MVKNLPAMQKMWVRSLGWEDPLEKETATHSSIPAWGIPWTEEPGGLQSMGSQRVGHERISNTHVQVLTGPIPIPSNKTMKRNIQVLSKENRRRDSLVSREPESPADIRDLINICGASLVAQ